MTAFFRIGRWLACCTGVMLLAVGVALRADDLRVEVTGFDHARLHGSPRGTVWRQVLAGARPEYGFAPEDASGRNVGEKTEELFDDVLPTSLAEVRYRYTVRARNGEIAGNVETSPGTPPTALLPALVLPAHPAWAELYQKAWEFTWKRIVTSAALPSRFAYCDYPDNGTTYVWDSCFTSLFQRYAAISGAHPGMATLDDFYAQETPGGYLCRNFNCPTFQPRSGASKVIPSLTGTNPPLFAWAEWNYYLISADRGRLARVLPGLIRHYDFIESFMQPAPGRYVWDNNGSGWDNILEVEKFKYWVELPALQALAARHIAKIAGVLGEEGVQHRFEAEVEQKRAQLEPYWNPAESWYCSLDQHGRFTGKTLAGMWPVLAGLVPKDRIALIVRDNLMNPARFLTEPMPLPTVAKDEAGYNPRGAYWLGGVWINMSIITIRSLEENGYRKEALELATRTLDGIARVSADWTAKPGTLWECYAPEFDAPASHKRHPELGTVRSDFGGYTCGLINLLVEDVVGIQVNAPAHELTWSVDFPGTEGIERLRFGGTTTSLRKQAGFLVVQSDQPYRLIVRSGAQVKKCQVMPGTNTFEL